MLRAKSIKRLIIMNEIQRFKKGRVIKAGDGTKFTSKDLVKAGRGTWGSDLYYDKRTGNLVKISSSNALERDGYTTGEVVATADELSRTGYSTYGLFSGWDSIGPY
jgi:hypothetical protein